jgi:hypothetical protein
MKTIITSIIAKLESDIQKLVSAYAASHEKHTGKPMTNFQLAYTEIMVTYDFIKSVEKYTTNEDILLSVSSTVSHKGNLEINVRISRNTKEYSLSTEVIYAGGYNIQQLHYRYITHTNLPKSGNCIITDEYAAKLKKMTKIEKLQEQLGYDEKTAKQYQDKLNNALNMSDDQIIEELKQHEYKLYSGKYTWEMLSEQGKLNYESKEKFEQKAMDDLKMDIARFKHNNITLMKSYLNSMNKQIEKTISKIASL